MEDSHSVLSLIKALIEARTGGPFRPYSVHGRSEHHLLLSGTSRRVTDMHSADGHPARINSEINKMNQIGLTVGTHLVLMLSVIKTTVLLR